MERERGGGKEGMKPVQRTGRNVTTERFYTSVELAEELYKAASYILYATVVSPGGSRRPYLKVQGV